MKTKEEILIEIEEQQLRYLKKINEIVKRKPPKRAETAIRRAFQVVNLAMTIRCLDIQKKIVASQPLFPKGKEKMILKNGKTLDVPETPFVKSAENVGKVADLIMKAITNSQI